MRIYSLIAGMLLVSVGLSGCGDDPEASSNQTAPAADVEGGSSDVSETDVGSMSGDVVTVDGAQDAGSVVSLASGPDDEYSTAGCALLEGEKTAIIAASNLSEAGQLVLLPSATAGFAIALPESGVGFVTLEVPDWQVVIALYTTLGVEIVIHDPDDKTEVVQALGWAAPCAEQQITEERTKYHKWGGFTLELRGESGGEVWLAAIDLPLE